MTAQAVGQLLFGLAVVIAVARGFGYLAKRVGQPPVIGEILAGILVGPSLFGSVVSDRLFPMDVRPALHGLANVGLVLFMFVIGYELDHTLVRGRKKLAASVSIGSIALPLGLGVALALWLAKRHAVGDVVPFALFVGAAMSVTAFPVLARIVADRGMLRTEVGGLALASAAVDDIAAWSLLAVVIALGGSGSDMPWQVLLAVPYIAVMVWWVRPLLRRLAAARERAGRLTPDILGAILVGLLLSCYVTELIGLHAIFGAFLFGSVMPRAGGEALRHEILERLEQVSVLLLLPVFFVLAGMKVDLSTIGGAALGELGLILLVAIAGKFIGAYAGARLHRVGPRRAGALAALMNARGLTEIVILTVGLQLGILDGQLFSMMVVMALVTTAMAGPLLALVYPKRLVDRDAADVERTALRGAGAYRVLVVVPDNAADLVTAGLVTLATDIAAAHRGPQPAEVLLSRFVPYPRTIREVGSGLSDELLAMTRAMEDLATQSRQVRARGVHATVLARFTTDRVSDLLEQVRTGEPDTVVVARADPAYRALRDHAATRLVAATGTPLPDQPGRIAVRGGDDADGLAALRTGAQLAAARGVELAVDTTARTSRRVAAVVRELGQRGVAVGFGLTPADAAIVVAADAGTVLDAHVVVRAGPEAAPHTWREKSTIEAVRG